MFKKIAGIFLFFIFLNTGTIRSYAENDSRSYVKIGQGEVKLGGYIQTGFEHFEKSGSVDQFKIKTAVFGFTGKVSDNINYKIEIDVAKNNTLLNDAFIKCTSFNFANLTIGQFKIPFSEEYVTSNTNLDTIERSLPVTGLSPGRDKGAMIDASLCGKKIYYAAGVFNGTGQNTAEENGKKDIAGRIVIIPFADRKDSWPKGLSFGINYMTGKEGPGDTTDYSRERTGGLVKYEYGNFKAQSEYISQKKDYVLDSKTDITEKGWYALSAYKINTGFPKIAVQPVVKYEVYNPDKITTYGVNLFLNDFTKLMLDYRDRGDTLIQVEVKI